VPGPPPIASSRWITPAATPTELGADLRTIDDSYTYTAEDPPERTAQVLADWLDKS